MQVRATSRQVLPAHTACCWRHSAQVAVGFVQLGVATRCSRVECAALWAMHQRAHSTLEPFTRSCRCERVRSAHAHTEVGISIRDQQCGERHVAEHRYPILWMGLPAESERLAIGARHPGGLPISVSYAGPPLPPGSSAAWLLRGSDPSSTASFAAAGTCAMSICGGVAGAGLQEALRR